MSNMLEELWNSNTIYLTIVWGKLSQKVDEDTPWAKKREYETSDGNKGVKYEKHYKSVTGLIAGLDFKETDFGENLVVTLVNWADEVVLSLNTDGKYFTSFARKLNNIDLNETVTIGSFDFESDGKRFTWVSIYNKWDKVEDYYYDGKKNLHGFPNINQDDLKEEWKDYWKWYFLEVKKFLKKEVKKVKVPEVKRATIDDAKDIFEDTDSDISNPPF